MAQEFELKLQLPVRATAAFRRDRLLTTLAAGPKSFQRLHSIYFDTPERALSASGVALRVRRIGRRWVQTIKLPAGIASANVHEELERTVPGPVPTLDPSEIKSLKQGTDGPFDPAMLAPVFETRVRRTIWPLRLDGTAIELAHDAGRITANDGSERIAEVELELKEGSAGHLFELAAMLLERHPLRIETRTKAARGFALADGRPPAPLLTAPAPIQARMTVREALAATAEACIAHYNANALALRRSSDPEGVHQMRVSLRRLRALVSACGEALEPDVRAFLAAELRWLQQQLGPARDWDVFIAETLEPMQRRLVGDVDLPAIREVAQARREEGYRQARAALDDPHHTRIFLRMGAWLATGDWVRPDAETSLDIFAAERLQERHRKLRKYGKAVDLPMEELHRLRIAAKKMRYVGEFFRPIYPKKASKAFFAALKDLQDDLGSLNDAFVTERLMGEIESRVVRRIGRIRAARARSLLTGWQAQRVEHDMERFLQVWERFRRCDPFWPKPRRPAAPAADGEDLPVAADEAAAASMPARSDS